MKLLMMVLAVALGCTMAHAQDRAGLLDTVRRETERANAPQGSAADRDAALARAIEARAQLMRSFDQDAQRPIWLLDQAADTLGRLSVTMADVRLVVGLLDSEERIRTLHMAEEAFLMADTAGGLIDARFDQQRSALESGGELTEDDRALNRRLAETELAVRRPLLMGRAMALQVAGGGDFGDTDRVIELLDGLRVGAGTPRMIRDNAMAIALTDGGSGEGRRRARALLDASLAQPAPGAGPLTLAEAALLRAWLGEGPQAQSAAIEEAAGGPPFVDSEGLRDAALLVLAVEAQARVLAENGNIEAAARTIMGLAERRDLGGSPAQWSAVIDDRLAALAERWDAGPALAPDVALRIAGALVAQDRPELDAKTASMLADLRGRIDAERQRAKKAGQPWTEPAETPAVAELLARLDLALADTEVDPAAAHERRRRAVGLVLDLLEKPGVDLAGLLSPAATLAIDPSAMDLDASQRRALLEAALGGAPGHAMADRWRLALAAMLIEDEPSRQRALELAQAAMRSGDPATRRDAIALAGAAHALFVAQADPKDPATLATLQRALEFVKAHPEATELQADALAVRVARGLIEGPRDAQAALAALGEARGREALVLRARALDQLKDREMSFEAYLAAADRLRPGIDGSDYWLVWTRLLEMSNEERIKHLEEGRTEAARATASRLRGHLLHLKAVDARLGGPPWARRLTEVEDALGP